MAKEFLGSIGLGNFVKAVMEHKAIRIYRINDDETIGVYKYNLEHGIYVDIESAYSIFKPEQFIAHFIWLIYHISYSWEVVEA